jgi:hypothetical protein
MRLTSVDAGERGIDPDGLVQGAGEAALGGRTLEAGQTAARVHAAARSGRIAAHELTVDRDEAEQVTLR